MKTMIDFIVLKNTPNKGLEIITFMSNFILGLKE